MKTKFILKRPGKKDVVFYIRRQKNTFFAVYNDHEYPCLPTGTIVTYNNQQRVITDKINLIDFKGIKLLVTDNGKYAGPKVTTDNGNKITYSFIGNNLRASFTLLMVFIIIMVVIFVSGIVAMQ